MESIYNWWVMIPNASGLLKATANLLTEEQKSVALLLPPDIPWYDEMKQRLEAMLDDPNKRFIVLECPEIEQPGKFISEKFFKKEARAQYNPRVGYAKLIAANDNESIFKNTIVYLPMKNISQLKEWISFIDEYDREKRSSQSSRGLFILEYRGVAPKLPQSLVRAIRWADYIHDYDKHIYAMLSVSHIKETRPVLEYLSEFISLLSGDDVELAAKLAERGTRCLYDTQAVFDEINSSEVRSDEQPFDISPNESRLKNLFWQSQVKSLFPQIERFKNRLLDECPESIKSNFTFTTAYGKIKNDYRELEIGEILFLNKNGEVTLSKELKEKAYLFHNCRNSLAHFSPVSFENTMMILKEKI